MELYDYRLLKLDAIKLAEKLRKYDAQISGKYYQDKHKCFFKYKETLVSYGEWEPVIEVDSIDYCPNFEHQDGCQNESCPSYKTYKKYQSTKKEYDAKIQKIEQNFPLLSLFLPYEARYRR